MATAGSTRAAVQAELLAFAEEKLGDTSIEVAAHDAATEFEARQVFEGTALTMSKLRVDELSVEQVRDFYARENWEANMAKTADKMVPTLLEEEDGCRIFHLRLQTPFILSNRSLFVAHYYVEGSDGSFTFMASSRGTDAIAEKYAANAGGDIVGEMVLTFVQAVPHAAGGVMLRCVNAMDPKGSIPDFLKKKLGKGHMNQLPNLRDFLLGGTVAGHGHG